MGLQLIAMLPAEHQRLVKYPLMLETLAKQCEKNKTKSKKPDTPPNDKPDGDETEQNERKSSGSSQAPKSPSNEDDDDPAFVESTSIKKYVERTREIVGTVDKLVAEAQNIQRLAEIQQGLDVSGLDKFPDSPISIEYRNVDLTQHRLIYDGILTMKIGDTRKIRTIELHVVLLEDCIMLLQKQDEKYILKFHTSTAAPGGTSGKFNHSPIIKFSTLLVRPVATDKRAFYLLNTTQNGPQIYELVASSTADRTQWFRHITEASNAYRARDTRGRGRGLYPADPLNNGLESSGDRGKTDDHLGLSESSSDKKGLPAGRSQSFHEQSTSSREPHHTERGPSSPPEERGDVSSSAKKAEKIRRKDQEVARALEEKHRLVAEYYQLPFDATELNDEGNAAAASAVSS